MEKSIWQPLSVRLRPASEARIAIATQSPDVRSATGIRAQVDGDRFLGAVADEVVRAVLCELRLEAARLVAGAGLLDLDDARTELGEDHRREWAGQHSREIQDGDAGERLHFLTSF